MSDLSFSHHDLLHIVAHARTIYELFEQETTLEQARADPGLIQRRLERWCQTAAGGDWRKFERRLGWDGLDLKKIEAYLSFQEITLPERLPAWATMLQASVQFALQNSRSCAYRFVTPDDPVPFEDVFAPLVGWARSMLNEKIGTASTLLSEAAHTQLERYLLKLLVAVSVKALYCEFTIYRTKRRSGFGRLFDRVEPARETRLYTGFIDMLFGGGLVAFLKEYSVLARRIATQLEFWIEAIDDFVQRLQTDLPAIAARFYDGQDPGQVTAVRLGHSDRHNHGRGVILLTFSSGFKLAYKPKNMGIEATFTRFVDWLNQNGVPLPLKAPKIWNCGSYGWVEFIDPTPVPDLDAARRFFQRSGMLTCLVYALLGNDYHYENIIACGEYPVLIDMETLLHPCVQSLDERVDAPSAHIIAMTELVNSVLRTGFLPRWHIDAEGHSFDISGLGGFGGQELYRQVEWKHHNTDAMTMEYGRGTTVEQANLPVLAGRPLNPDDYLEDYLAGFQQMYRFCIAQRTAIVAASPFRQFAGQQVRFIYRATPIYGVVQLQTEQAQYLRSGIDASIETDTLSRAFVPFPSKPSSWPVLKMEHQALALLDIPYLQAYTDRTDLLLESGVRIPNFFDAPSYDRAVALMQSFNAGDLEKQLNIIRASFVARVASRTESGGASREPAIDVEKLDIPQAHTLLEHACVLAAELHTRAIWSQDGSVAWLGLERDSQTHHYQLQPLGHSLYAGTPGIALFLAALEYSTGGVGFRDLALGAIRNIRHQLHTDPGRLARGEPVGGLVGLGSIAYVLLRMSEFLSDVALLEDARLAAALLSSAKIRGDRNLDIVEGVAGTLLILLALYQRIGDDCLLQRAVECGTHLLQNRVPTDQAWNAWPTSTGRVLTGFSHGAAGFAYALLKLYSITKERTFLDAAIEGMNYERSVFAPHAGNWPDFRGLDAQGNMRFSTSWCHGAPGIGLARLAALAVVDSAEMRAEVDIAIRTTQRYPMQTIDQLCCGNAGRIDFLLEAGRRLATPAFCDLAAERMAWMIARAQQKGRFTLFSAGVPGSFIPSFFQGTAGIGYEILRIADPTARLPSILLLE